MATSSMIRGLMGMLLVAAVAGRAAAQERPADGAAGASGAPASICLTIDVAHDTLTPSERNAALILLGRQFTASGWRVVNDGCVETYTVSHVRLGSLITVHIAGPRGEREGQAVGLEDLPALYSQMARSLVTGKPIGSLANIDRTNVTEAQTSKKRVAVDTFNYARLGYGAVSADAVYGSPMFGLGYRAEFDRTGLDVSYLTYQMTSNGGRYGNSSGVLAASILRIAGLHFFNGKGQASSYAGAGMSWGVTDVHHSSTNAYSSWTGGGLRAELIGGYELTRATMARTFVQADLVLPFYSLRSNSYSYSRTIAAVPQEKRYSPSLTISVGIGWHRDRK